MSYGKIYDTTWFGSALENCQTINDKPNIFASQFNMQDRFGVDIQAKGIDQATFEAKLCLSKKINEIGYE
jgi:hypothetical protein